MQRNRETPITRLRRERVTESDGSINSREQKRYSRPFESSAQGRIDNYRTPKTTHSCLNYGIRSFKNEGLLRNNSRSEGNVCKDSKHGHHDERHGGSLDRSRNPKKNHSSPPKYENHRSRSFSFEFDRTTSPAKTANELEKPFVSCSGRFTLQELFGSNRFGESSSDYSVIRNPRTGIPLTEDPLRRSKKFPVRQKIQLGVEKLNVEDRFCPTWTGKGPNMKRLLCEVCFIDDQIEEKEHEIRELKQEKEQIQYMIDAEYEREDLRRRVFSEEDKMIDFSTINETGPLDHKELELFKRIFKD